MKVQVEVRPRHGIADPQGATVAQALRDLGYTGVGEVRIGRSILLEVLGDDPHRVEAEVEEMCDRLLANPVIEDYQVRVLP